MSLQRENFRKGLAQRFLGYGLILTAAALWALIGPVARFSLERGVTPMEIAFWRALFGGFVFCLHALLGRSLQLRSPCDGAAFFCFGAVSIGGFFTVYQTAVLHGGAALASVLQYTAPAWVALLAWMFFREPLTAAKTAAAGLCLAGVAAISFSGPLAAVAAQMQGIAFGLLSGFLYATHYIFTKIYLRRYSSAALYGWSLLAGAVCLFPFVGFVEKQTGDWCALLVLGLCSTYAAYLAYAEGIRRLDPMRAAVFATFEPVFATFAAWWWWGEMFSPLGAAGALCILTAVFVTLRERSQSSSIRA